MQREVERRATTDSLFSEIHELRGLVAERERELLRSQALMAQLQRDKFTASRTADEVLQAATALSQDEADETIRKIKAEKEELAARVLELERELRPSRGNPRASSSIPTTQSRTWGATPPSALESRGSLEGKWQV
jgi:hypothetical protein